MVVTRYKFPVKKRGAALFQTSLIAALPKNGLLTGNPL
jgi:hypothetical protein